MSIITQCPQCGRKLRATDERLGKQVRCPQCKNVFTIQAASASSAEGGKARQQPAPSPQPVSQAATQEAPQQPDQPQLPTQPQLDPQTSASIAGGADAGGADKWFLQTADGAEYGPVTKQELDAWHAEDRVDRNCQILQEGWNQWKWAEDVYPQLAAAEQVEDSPFAGIGEQTVVDRNPYTKVDTGSNPYAAPSVAHSPSSTGSSESGDGLPSGALKAISDTRPWVLGLSIFGFVGAALMAFVSLLVIVFGGFQGIIPAMIYLVLGAIWGFGALLLLNYANRIGRLNRLKKASSLQAALVAQKNFWKYAGIMVVCYIAFLIVMVLIGALLGVAAAGFGR